MNISPNLIVVVVGEVILGVYVLLPWTDPTYKGAAIGAMIGLVGGHLNGSRASDGSTAPSSIPAA